MNVLRMVFLLVWSVAPVWAHNNYTGRSGGEASGSTCASSCHGATGGTILVSGFPTSYTPNQTYLITLSHGAGGAIVNFNASCRVGSGTTNAGSISAGTGTTVYNVAGETNGVHFTTSFNQDAGAFNWTAPPAGTGPVRLYLGGLQFDYDGPNTIIITDASEAVPPPLPPSAVVVMPNAPHIELSWQAVAGANSYNVYRSTVVNGSGLLIGNSTTTSYTDSFMVDQADPKAFYYVTTVRP